MVGKLYTNGDVSSQSGKHIGQRFSSPYITPRLTPSATPKIISTSVSPRGYSTVASPQITSGSTSPTKPSYDGRIALSPWYPSSQQSSAASSPPRSRQLAGKRKCYVFSLEDYNILEHFEACFAILYLRGYSIVNFPVTYYCKHLKFRCFLGKKLSAIPLPVFIMII